MSEEYGKELTSRWEGAYAKYQCYQMVNVANRDPIELARIRMEAEIARVEFQKVEAEMKAYVEKTYG